MAGEYTPAVLNELDAQVARGLEHWNLSPDTTIRLLNVSENATFLLDDPHGFELVLRVHRLGYSSVDEIRSELQWMEALRRDGIMDTAAAVAGRDGQLVQTLPPIGDGAPRLAVVFERLPGTEPDAAGAVQWFKRLGEATARMHRHARGWMLPRGFCRKTWDLETMVGEHGFWGPWRAAVGLDADGTAVLARAVDQIGQRLARFGRGADVFGLVHADLRLANLLVDGADLRIIDFDDCGFSWFVYDFATAVSFIEHEAVVPELMQAWCAGYEKASALRPAARAELATFVVLRRILLTAWIASHAEVPFAREKGAGFTAGTVALAEEFLGGRFLKV
jgi:Ser/Thr protein kinase RdoA (MazF antagonist)